MIDHPALQAGRVAVVTGSASGIGLACVRRFLTLGMVVVVADLGGDALDQTLADLKAAHPDAPGRIHGVATDVSQPQDLHRLKDAAYALGEVAVLMNNAGRGGGGKPWVNPDGWRQVLETNLFGVLNGVQAFAPQMIASGLPGLIINTGSKQGITNPPGDAAYNVSKAGIKVLTEQMAHALRNEPGCKVTAHLLVPGHTFTGMTARGGGEKPPSAWSADQVAEFMLQSLVRGDFYILCPDNEVTRDMDERRMQWAVDDLISNRPALSRWHPDYAAAFARFMAAPR